MAENDTFHLPLPDEIKRTRTDSREIDYTKFGKVPVGGQVNLRGDSQLGIQNAAVNIMPNIQQFLGNSGTYFGKAIETEDNFAPVDITKFSCDCGGKYTFRVIKNIPEYRAKVVCCTSCGVTYGLIPESVYDIISSPAGQALTQNEMAIIIARQPKTNMYVVFQR